MKLSRKPDKMDGVTERSELIIDTHSVRTGAESVGLPGSCTTEVLLERYVSLIRLARTGSLSDPVALRGDDMDVLARATGLESDAVQARLVAMMEPVA
jgi:hypothetical protein